MKQLLKKIFCEKKVTPEILPGETEFDYIPKEEIEKIKKKSPKKENVIIHPKVKKNFK